MPINKGYMTVKTDKKSDEYYTPPEAIVPIIKYLNPKIKVWCPFDKEFSQYVKLIKENGNEVVYSHIDDGYNFFYYEPKSYDVIISNPPFSLKDDILKRLDELNKPFAILLPLPTLQGKKRFDYLIGTQALIFDKRINFYQDEEQKIKSTGVSFASIYICKNFLPNDLIYTKL